MSGFRPVPLPNSKTYDNQQSNMAVERIRNELEAVPFLGANIIEGVTFTAGGTQTVAHKLGKDWRAWWPVYRLASADYVALQPVSNPAGYTNASHFSVSAKYACTVDFLVF